MATTVKLLDVEAPTAPSTRSESRAGLDSGFTRRRHGKKTSWRQRALEASTKASLLAGPFIDLVATESLCYWSSSPLLDILGHETTFVHTIPRLAIEEPAVRHALEALYVTNEHANVSSAQSPRAIQTAGVSSDALRAYNRSIEHLLKMQTLNSQQRAFVILTVCALFVCFEAQRGNPKLAATHVQHGIGILKQQGVTEGDLVAPASYRLREDDHWRDLVLFFSRLRFHSIIYQPDVVPRSVIERSLNSGPVPPRASFESLWDARQASWHITFHCLNFINSHRVARLQRAVTPQSRAQQAVYRNHLDRWLVAWEAFTEKEAHTWNKHLTSIAAVTEMLIHSTWIWLSTCLTAEQCAWDPLSARFELILDLAERGMRGFKGAFRLEGFIINTLHFVGVKCREPRLRRKALSLLGKRHWREGIYDSFEAYRIVYHQMMLEEENVDVAEAKTKKPDEKDRIQVTNLGGLVQKTDGAKLVACEFIRYPNGIGAPPEIIRATIDLREDLAPVDCP